ncbi:MAG: CAP domain-containing protein [Methanoregulaceae archaeon]|nr:CAP domain-containing protein [Methanoregulaceae archaeon]
MSTVSSRQLCVILVFMIAMLPFFSAAGAAATDTTVRFPVLSYSGTQVSLPKVGAEVRIPDYSGTTGSVIFPTSTEEVKFPVFSGSQGQVTLPKVTGEVKIPGYSGGQVQTGPSPLYSYTKPELGVLVVGTTPAGARVFIDGAYSGTTPLTLQRVYAGVHVVSIMMPNYLSYTRVVRVNAGQETVVEAVLEAVTVETPASVPAPTPMGLSAVDQAIAKYTNIERTSRGLPALAWDSSLAAIAYTGSMDMKDRDFFSHINPDGHDPFWRIENAGYVFAWAGENIAASSRISEGTDPDEVGRYFVQDLWMNSPGHKANILNEHYTLIGVGTVYESNMDTFPNGFISTQLFASKE